MNEEFGRKLAMFLFTSIVVITITTYGYQDFRQTRFRDADQKFKEVMRVINDPNSTQKERDEALAEYEKFMDSL